MLRITTVCLVCAVTSGCLSFGGAYPISWAEQESVESGGCPVIDGEYQDTGEMFHETDGQYINEAVSLVRVLSGWADDNDRRLDLTTQDPAADAYQTVRLQLAGNVLRVTASTADDSTKTFELPVSSSCRDALLTTEADWDGATNLIASYVDRSSLALGRATDGSLLVRTTSMASLLIVYWPLIAGKEERWMKFSAALPAPLSAMAAGPAAPVVAAGADERGRVDRSPPP